MIAHYCAFIVWLRISAARCTVACHHTANPSPTMPCSVLQTFSGVRLSLRSPIGKSHAKQ